MTHRPMIEFSRPSARPELCEMWTLASGGGQASSQRIGPSQAELQSAGVAVKGFLTKSFWSQSKGYFSK